MLRVAAQRGILFARARVLTIRALVGGCALFAALPCVAAPTAPGTRIVNVATGTCVLTGEPAQPSVRSFASNPATTIVAPAITFDGVVLSVSPAGAVSPGAALTYTLVAENRSGMPLSGAVLKLPLDSGLDPPGSISATPGAPAPTSVGFDAGTRVVTWTFASVALGARLSVQVTANVRADVATEALIEETGSSFATENPIEIASNTVVTPIVPPALTVLKRADRGAAAPGDAVAFSLEVRNVGTFVVSDASVVDTLPPGLAFLPGSARIDGVATEPVVSADGRTLRFDLGVLAPADVRVVRLAARVTALARAGEVVNRAAAAGRSPGGYPFSSGRSSATVRVVPGPFRREAILAGRVFVDDDGDGLSGAGEPGVPGVLVALEDGRGAVTDVTGRWHVEGVRPGLHVVRLDRDTLPETLAPRVGNTDWAADAGSRFVEVRPAALAVIDLAVGPGGSARCRICAGSAEIVVPAVVLLDEPDRLRPAAAAHLEHAAQLLVERGARDPRSIAVTCDADDGGLAALAITRVLRERLALRVVAVGIENEEPGGAAASPESEPPKDSLEQVVRTADVAAAIVSPADGARASGSSVAVEVTYPIGLTPELRVNGSPVPGERIGTTSTLPSRGLSASRYVGVPLAEGANRIELRAVGADGNPDGVAPVAITVGRPGRISDLRITVPESRWVADAATPGVLRIEATDASGLRVAESPSVTLDAEGAQPLDPDADPDADGWQIRLDDGAATIRFAPRVTPGRFRARAAWEALASEIFVDVAPSGAGWRVVGLAEATVAGDAGVEGDGGGPPGLDDDPADSGGRLAFTARGPIGASSRAVVSVDTARERDDDRLFGGFEPDAFFPIYGDTSAPVEEAARQGPVFARIDGPRGFAQYGDFATGLERTELSRYDRRLEGASGRVALGRATIEGFAAATEQTIARDVFAPDGTSGPFLLTKHPVVARSERIVVEIRDRQRTDEVLARQAKIADIDYDLDAEAGTILFRGPIAPFDAAMNPMRIVVLYEVHAGGDSQIAAGARVAFQPTARVETGVSAIHEERAGDDLAIYGADVTWRPLPGTTVRAEVAATAVGGATETASRLEIQSQPGAQLGWQLAFRDVPAGFANPTLLGAPELGSRRIGGNVLWDPSGRWHLKGEAFQQQDDVSGVARTVAGVDVERRFPAWSLLGGVKKVSSDSAAGTADSALAEVGARGKLGGNFMGEIAHRQVLGSETAPGYPTRTGAGITWEFAEAQRLVLRHEIESGDGPSHDRTSLGFEGRVGRNSRAYSRYELAGGASATSLRSTTGIETVLPLQRGAALQLSGSRVDTSQGSDDGDFTTLGAGFEKRFGDVLFTSRYEILLAKHETRHVATVAGALRLSEPWTLFARERIFVNDPDLAASAGAAEGLFGAAYRPIGKVWQALFRLDHLDRGGSPATAGGVVAGGVPSEPASAGALAARPPGAPGVGTFFDRGAATPDSVALSLAAGAQVSARQRVALTGIFRRVGALPELGADANVTTLLGAHYTTQLHARFTLGGSARRFAQQGTGTGTYGIGIEIGWLALRNLWLTGGYNVIGFRDPWAAAGDRTEAGPFVALRFKFDEGSLETLRDLRIDRGPSTRAGAAR